MPLIYQQEQVRAASSKNGTRKCSAPVDLPAPTEMKVNANGSLGDEWIEQHSNSSTFVKERLRKFQSDAFREKLAPEPRPSSAFVSQDLKFKSRGLQNSRDNHSKSQLFERQTLCSPNGLSAENKKMDDRSGASDSNKNGGSTSLLSSDRKSSNSTSSVVEDDHPIDFSVSKLSSVFEPTRPPRRSVSRTTQSVNGLDWKTNNSNNNNNNNNNNSINNSYIDYLSVLKPSRTSEWSRNIQKGRSVVCLNAHQSTEKDSAESDRSAKKSGPISSYDSSEKGNTMGRASCDPGKSRSPSHSEKGIVRSVGTVETKMSSSRGNTLPRLTCAPASAPAIQTLRRQVPSQKTNGVLREVVFRKPSYEDEDDVPFFRSILRHSEHSDSILYEDKPANCLLGKSSRGHVKSEEDKRPSPRMQQKGDDSTPEERSRVESFQKSDYKGYLSLLEKCRKDKTKGNAAPPVDGADSKSTAAADLPFYQTKLRRTDLSARIYEGNALQPSRHDADPNDRTNASDDRVDSTVTSPSLPSETVSACDADSASASLESLRSTASDASSDAPIRSTLVLLRKQSADGLGSMKRRGVVNVSDVAFDSPLFLNNLVLDGRDFGVDAAAASYDDDDDECDPSELRSQNANQKRSKLDLTLEELHTSEVNYVDKLDLVEHFKSELLRAKVVTDQEASAMFLNTSEILKFHRERMLPEVERAATLRDSCMGRIFDELAPKLIIYSECLVGFADAMRAISHKESKSASFQRCIRDLQGLPRCEGLSLQGHMLNPVQRIPKYILILKQYIKLLPPEEPDLVRAKNGLQSLLNVATCNNRSIKKSERRPFTATTRGGGDKLGLLCISCGRDVTRKYVRCTNCQKFYCKACFSDRQSISTAKLKFCIPCLAENRQSTLKLKAESLKLKDGLLQVRKSKDNWTEQWFVIDSSGKFYSISTYKNDFDKIDAISLEGARLTVRDDSPKYANVFVLHLKGDTVRHFRAPNREEFDGWIEGFKSVLTAKQCILLPSTSLEERSNGGISESET